MNICLVRRWGRGVVVELPVEWIVIFDHDVFTHGKRGQCDFVVDIVDFELWECDEALARVIGELGIELNDISVER